jgi:hypothetical protein
MEDDRLERLLLCDDATLRALAAWVSLPKARKGAAHLEQWADSGIWFNHIEWAVSAMMSGAELQPVKMRLCSMAIIDEDGEPWPPAMALARNLAAAKIKRRSK